MAPADSSRLRATLLEHANPGGGWPYYPGRSSRLEPTCWALLALGAAGKDFDPTPHWRFLLGCQRASGFLVEDPALPNNLGFNALAAVTLLKDLKRKSDPAVPKILAALVAQAGLQVAQSPNFRQDNSLRGWPWIEGTFSWVEPTAWAVLALKHAESAGIAPRETRVRLEEAERMLIDRCCRDGGWNYGNANALGKELFPYVSVTALALLALRSRREADAVTRSLRFLQAEWPNEASTIGLGLSAICLRRFALPTDNVDRALIERLPLASSLDNLHAIAIALYAIAVAPNDSAFAV